MNKMRCSTCGRRINRDYNIWEKDKPLCSFCASVECEKYRQQIESVNSVFRYCRYCGVQTHRPIWERNNGYCDSCFELTKAKGAVTEFRSIRHKHRFSGEKQ